MERLLEIMRRLRDPQNGCAWDRQQTFETIVPHTLEESYEVADCIERGAFDDLKSELGDLLFQVVFYAEMAREQGLFDFDDVVVSISNKLTERHPHVFGDAESADLAELGRRWEAQKARERSLRDPTASTLDDVPLALPALSRARKLQQRASRVGFDWPDSSEVKYKLYEELEELEEAVLARDELAIEEEWGDMIFAAVNWARHLSLDPERALRQASRKFEQRFRYIEMNLAERQLKPEQASLELMDELWNAAKKHESYEKN